MVLYLLSWPPEPPQPCVCWETEGKDEHSPPEAPCTLLQACLHPGLGWLPHAWGNLWWSGLGELSPTASSLSLCETVSKLRHCLPALLPLRARSWAEALVAGWQAASLPFPGVCSSGVWSGPVWMSGVVQWLSCRASSSRRSWCLSHASADLPVCIPSLQGLSAQ